MIGAGYMEIDMDKDLIAKLAHAAGLDKALGEYPTMWRWPPHRRSATRGR